MPDAVVVHRSEMGSLDQTTPNAIIDLMRLALEKNIPVDALERLQALHERVTARQAAAEFAQAVATFQERCPQIGKNKLTDYATSSGVNVKYNYADFPQIAKVIAPHLQAVGLSFTHDSVFEGGMMTVKCILRHINGHSETAQFTCPTESKAGMSGQQKNAAALSYGRRQSLIQVLGLVTADPEEPTQDMTPVTEEEAEALELLCDELKVTKSRFLRWVGVDAFAKVPARRYQESIETIKATAAQRAAKGGTK